jgi:hypothetical protein
MIKAVNKVLKYNFLFPFSITNGVELAKLVPKHIETYNSVRPHYTLKGLTPDKVHSGAHYTDLSFMKSVNLVQNKQKSKKREVTCNLC